MSKKIIAYCLGMVMLAGFAACNSDSDDTVNSTTILTYSNTAVTKFSLASNKNVMNNLDSVYFSIDLVNARIFNASPLPQGTKIDKLVVEITTDNCSVTELHVPREGKSDTIINYLTDATSPINFSNGPVKLHVKSADGLYSRDYAITINVYDINPDSLQWDADAVTKLPSTLSAPTAQGLTRHAGRIYMVTTDDSGATSLASTSDPYDFNQWHVTAITPGFTPVAESLTSTTDALYMLSDAGELYASTDFGSTWTDCSIRMDHVYGGFVDTVVGVIAETDGSYSVVTYPSGQTSPLPAGMPVTGTSDFVEVNNDWSLSPQVMMVGGRLSDGTVSSDTWGYDGQDWVSFSTNDLPPSEGRSLINYTYVSTDTTTWRVGELPVLLSFGGNNADGRTLKGMFYSKDLGLHWTKAPATMQLPDEIGAMTGAKVVAVKKMIDESYSRAIAPIDEWECDYLYIMGGRDSQGRLRNSIWRGAINYFTLKPLQ